MYQQYLAVLMLHLNKIILTLQGTIVAPRNFLFNLFIYFFWGGGGGGGAERRMPQKLL